MAATASPVIGVDGSGKAGVCTRKINIVLLHFPLSSELSGTTITDIEIRLQIDSVAGKGVHTVLHGLRTSGSTLSETLSQQSMDDYFVGTDPPPGTELLSARFLEGDVAAAGNVYTYSSPQLSSHVQT